jgi:hypothetical protein
MCAIDALGMADMLGRNLTITSTDPDNGQQIRVEIQATLHERKAVWAPPTTVVVVGSPGTAPAADGCCPPHDCTSGVAPAADRCCTAINFFTSADSAQHWLNLHPEVAGVIFGQRQALRLGADIFGRLLNP